MNPLAQGVDPATRLDALRFLFEQLMRTQLDITADTTDEEHKLVNVRVNAILDEIEAIAFPRKPPPRVGKV
jgi:hypothetical protein